MANIINKWFEKHIKKHSPEAKFEEHLAKVDPGAAFEKFQDEHIELIKKIGEANDKAE